MLRRLAIAAMLAAVLAAPSHAQIPLGTGFTYQGHLQQDGLPYTGPADLSFRLYDDPAAGTLLAPPVDVYAVDVVGGVFTVTLDFGAGQIADDARWLEILVQTPAYPSWEALTPRQAIAPAPVALYALSAPSGGGGGPWVVNGADVTYPGGSVGVTGASSPFASGKGVFFEGGNASRAHVFAYNYDGLAPLSLILNSPGGNVGIGQSTPGAKLDVLAGSGIGVRSATTGSAFQPVNAAITASGATSTGGITAMGVYATSTGDRAVAGFSTNYWGVSGDCTSAGTYGILGTPNEGMFALSPSVAKPAGRFVCPSGGIAIDASTGLVRVKTLQIVGGADVAERFEVEGAPEPGTVLVIDEQGGGRLRAADEAYSHRVAGVVSGARDLDAGVVLSADGRTEGTAPVALTGRVWVRCDATTAPIRVGDLLTTSSRDGHAMRASDRKRAPGAILGKAMSALDSGTGMVLVLVSLQ